MQKFISAWFNGEHFLKKCKLNKIKMFWFVERIVAEYKPHAYQAFHLSF